MRSHLSDRGQTLLGVCMAACERKPVQGSDWCNESSIMQMGCTV